MTLGIPTQSDVVDVKYKKALMQEKIKSHINSFPASTMDIHNAINSHYNGSTVDSQEILNLYLNKIQNFQTNLFDGIEEKVTSMSYKFNSSTHPNEYGGIILQAPNERYKTLVSSSNIKIKERSSIMQKLSGKPKYKISFSPYRTAMTESSTLRTQLKNSQKGKKTIDDLLNMEKIIEEFEENNANTAILNHRLTNRFKTPDEFESDKNSNAYKLKQKHEKIAKESNIYLSFNEKSWIENKNNEEIGYPINEPIHNYEDLGFLAYNENTLKKLINEEITKTGTVIINGIIVDSYESLADKLTHNYYPYNGAKI